MATLFCFFLVKFGTVRFFKNKSMGGFEPSDSAHTMKKQEKTEGEGLWNPNETNKKEGSLLP